MGMLDDAKRLKKAIDAQPEDLPKSERVERAKEALAEEDRAEQQSEFADDAEEVHVERIDTAGAGLTGVVTAYIGILGLKPEDTYGVWPTRTGGDGGAIYEIAIAHRDTPEYRSAQARFAKLQAD